MGKVGLSPPNIWISYKSLQIALSIRFQRALDRFSIFLQTRVMPIFVFCGPKPQIWKFCHQASKILDIVETYNSFLFVSRVQFQRALDSFAIYMQT